MKKKALLVITLCVIFCLALVISASAQECDECNYEYKVELGANGFFDTISSSATCTVCNNIESTTISPVFMPLGYSYSENGICQGYAINRESLAKYEAQTGESVRFGAVIATTNAIGNSNPLDKDGNPVSDKVKVADLTDTKYDIIDVVITGIPSLLKSSVGLMCSMYVNAGGRIYYLDNLVQKENCGANTYNEIVDVPAKEEASATPLVFVNGKLYTRLDVDLVQAKFWNNQSLGDSAGQTAFNNKFWATSNSYTKETLPNGALIVLNDLDQGWQYRPHKWSGTRPDNTKNGITEVSDEWWGSYTKVGFNISQTTNKAQGASNNTNDLADISGYTEEQIKVIFQILIPYVANESTGGGTQEPDTPTEPEEPNADYSAQKQNWNDDGELKILAIGNSFSVDSMEWIYQVAQDVGIEKITLGNLYIGGCTLASHLNNVQNNTGYTYYLNTSGTWQNLGSKNIKTAVQSDDWDFITFQQASGSSGIASTYDDLDALIDIVEPLNPSARLAWHMTWAYQANSTHSEFSKYDNNQLTMYNAITSAVQSNILTENRIEIVIPAGTAIQNTRTSYIGDTLTRDGYHLSNDLGRYIGALSYVSALTGKSIADVTYMPSGVDIQERMVAIESVTNALKTPYSITNSTYTSEPELPKPEIDFEEYIKTLSLLDYTYIGLVKSAYYNSSNNGNTLQSTENSTAGNLPNFFATKLFTKETLPVGSVIYVASGWQFRPEFWPSGTRPDNDTTTYTYVDETWWDAETQRGFNISLVSGASLSSYTLEDISEVFKIYVPASAVELNKPQTTEPEEPEAPDAPEVEDPTITEGYAEVELTLTQFAYYDSEANKNTPVLSQKSASDSVGKKYYATQVFTKEDLPVGSIIYVSDEWNYRPDGWQRGSTSRPNPENENYIVVDEEWWGTYTQRAFNISRDDGTSMSGYTEEDINENFKIYVPVSE